ncbi:hypothetical protein EQM14_04760 [Caproiciproducens sp. NJN-50]|uniref:hypothetical protein n=1 Tax=Caproiciproducens sp. NJN-50 TaxID=2507162 RepID=UPI000FFDF895|nr:hypothetical protein [Caproiciproducens sp. NJN-50]QAT49139.1 hypothetical protein EQM14_04760 [Caproiciproducens sp. NJN-50]
MEKEEFQKAFVLACRFLSDTIGCPKIYTEEEDIQGCTSDGENCEKEDQWECWQHYFLERVSTEEVCRICGCTQDNACPGGCWWIKEDLCSSCYEKLKSQSAS